MAKKLALDAKLLPEPTPPVNCDIVKRGKILEVKVRDTFANRKNIVVKTHAKAGETDDQASARGVANYMAFIVRAHAARSKKK